MWKFLAAIFASGTSVKSPMRIASWWLYAVRLPNRVRTPLGSNVSIVDICVDIEYEIRDEQPTLRTVRLSRTGTPGPSGNACNMAATNVGEIWYADGISPTSVLVAAVETEMVTNGSNLRRKMFGQWDGRRRKQEFGSVANGLNNRVTAEELDALIARAGRQCVVSFTYASPKRGPEKRKVVVHLARGATIRVTDTKDDLEKEFRIDRISNAREVPQSGL